jgi:hypothetical protein
VVRSGLGITVVVVGEGSGIRWLWGVREVGWGGVIIVAIRGSR